MENSESDKKSHCTTDVPSSGRGHHADPALRKKAQNRMVICVLIGLIVGVYTYEIPGSMIGCVIGMVVGVVIAPRKSEKTKGV